MNNVYIICRKYSILNCVYREHLLNFLSDSLNNYVLMLHGEHLPTWLYTLHCQWEACQARLNSPKGPLQGPWQFKPTHLKPLVPQCLRSSLLANKAWMVPKQKW